MTAQLTDVALDANGNQVYVAVEDTGSSARLRRIDCAIRASSARPIALRAPRRLVRC